MSVKWTAQDWIHRQNRQLPGRHKQAAETTPAPRHRPPNQTRLEYRRYASEGGDVSAWRQQKS